MVPGEEIMNDHDDGEATTLHVSRSDHPLGWSDLLADKVALVTGVGPGLGSEMVRALARHGASVALVARSDRVAPGLAEELCAAGAAARAYRADIVDRGDVERLADQLRSDWGRLDILVNSAFSAGRMGEFADADLAKWRTPMEVNYHGSLQLTQALLPLISETAANSGDARIIFVNTMSVNRLEAGHGSYAGSKAALGAVAKTLAQELGPRGIRVNSIHPGYIWGESVRIYFEWQAAERDDATWQDVYDETAAETALRSLPTPEEIAGAVVFYASPLARCVTGTALPVNGGHWMPSSA